MPVNSPGKPKTAKQQIDTIRPDNISKQKLESSHDYLHSNRQRIARKTVCADPTDLDCRPESKVFTVAVPAKQESQ